MHIEQLSVSQRLGRCCNAVSDRLQKFGAVQFQYLCFEHLGFRHAARWQRTKVGHTGHVSQRQRHSSGHRIDGHANGDITDAGNRGGKGAAERGDQETDILAISTDEAVQACACVAVYAIRALCTILARRRGTFVNLRLAQAAGVASNTAALETVHLVHTRPLVFTLHAGTVVDVILAKLTIVAGHTLALIVGKLVHAGAVVLAIHRETLVNLLAASHTLVAGGTETVVPVNTVNTGSPIFARAASALVHSHVTIRASEAGCART